MPDVHADRADRVAILTLNGGSRADSVGGTLFADLLDAHEDDFDDTVGAIATTGGGRTNCGGADAAELDTLIDGGRIDLADLGVDGIGGANGPQAQPPSQIRADHVGIGGWVRRVVDTGAPMVAAVSGPAAGGGSTLLLHDVRIAHLGGGSGQSARASGRSRT
jgi:enoyl-CoA hydratase/carnithine racemase